jgi:hypothetical protein
MIDTRRKGCYTKQHIRTNCDYGPEALKFNHHSAYYKITGHHRIRMTNTTNMIGIPTKKNIYECAKYYEIYEDWITNTKNTTTPMTIMKPMKIDTIYFSRPMKAGTKDTYIRQTRIKNIIEDELQYNIPERKTASNEQLRNRKDTIYKDSTNKMTVTQYNRSHLAIRNEVKRGAP